MKQQSADTGKTRRSTPHSPFTPPPPQHKVLALRRLRRSAGEALGEARVPGTVLQAPPLPRLGSPSARWGGGPAAGKTSGLFFSFSFLFFSRHHADTKNQFFIFVFRGSALFYLFGICRDNTSFFLILYTGNEASEQLICLWQQETANLFPNFSNK